MQEVSVAVRPLVVAEHVLHLRTGISTTSLELNKLVFLLHGWTWGLLSEPLVSDDAEAWELGPVYRDIHEKFHQFKGAAIPHEGVDHSQELGQKTEFVAAVAKILQEYSAGQLVGITHLPGSPWHQIWHKFGQAPIPDSLVKSYYEDLAKTNP